jgi:hypothetical protein
MAAHALIERRGTVRASDCCRPRPILPTCLRGRFAFEAAGSAPMGAQGRSQSLCAARESVNRQSPENGAQPKSRNYQALS